MGGFVVAQPGGKGVHQLLRDAAHAEAFHDDAVVQTEDLRDKRRGHPRRQLEQEHPAVQRAAELHRPGGPRRRDVPHQPVALHQRQLREVDRRKGVVADGLVLFGAGARDDVPAKHHHHAPAARVDGADYAVPQVFLGIRDLVGDGLLCAGKDDRLIRVLNQIRERRRRVRQRIRAVADDKAVVQGVVFLNGACHHEPVLLPEVGAVDAAQRQRFRAAQLLQLRQMGKQFLAGKHRLEPLLGAHAGNGAAGGDEKQTLFGHKAKAPCGSNFNMTTV